MPPRDPQRIDDVLVALGAYWRANPDLRLCQIVGNFLNEEHAHRDIRLHVASRDVSSRGYATEDGAFLKWLGAQNRSQT